MLFDSGFGVMGAGMGTMLACAVISLTGAWFCCVRNPQLRLRRKEKRFSMRKF